MNTIRRKQIVLSIREKVDIVEALKRGVPPSNVAEKFNIGKSTISEIKKNADSIFSSFSAFESGTQRNDRKTMRNCQNEDLGKAVYTWFLQKRSLNQLICGTILCEKALQFNKMLSGPSDFKASTGWLKNFKHRHGIRQVKIHGEMLSNNFPNAEAFISEFHNVVKDDGYDLEHIYNADETGLFWKVLPGKSLISKQEKTVGGRKPSKE